MFYHVKTCTPNFHLLNTTFSFFLDFAIYKKAENTCFSCLFLSASPLNSFYNSLVGFVDFGYIDRA